MFKAFTRLFFKGDDPTLAKAVARAVDDGLDLRAAIAAHENWKIRLEAYLAGHSSEDLRAEVICFDDRCDLGKWIHSSGKARLGTLPAFLDLVSDHKEFHYAASNVVALSKAGRSVDAGKMLNGPYSRASARVVGSLTDMMNIAEKARKKS